MIHPAPQSLHRCGLRGAVKVRPADTEVKLPDGLLSTLFLQGLLSRLIAAQQQQREQRS